MRSGVQRLMDPYYPAGSGGERPADGTNPLYEWMLGAVSPDAMVLNIGAAPPPGEIPRRLRGRFRRIVGVVR